MMNKIREKYLNEAERFRLLVADRERLLLILSVLRFFAFTGGLIIIWYLFTRSIFAGVILIPVVTVLFLWLLKLYAENSEGKIFLENLANINKNEADAVSGDLSPFESGELYGDPDHYFSNDVDLFGRNSIFQYLNRSVTGFGRDLLAGWLLDPYFLHTELVLRQEAIKELATKGKWRHEFMASGMKTPLDKSHIAGLLTWMDEGDVIKSSVLKNLLIYILPSASVLSVLAVAAGWMNFTVFAFIFLFNLLCITAGLKKTNKVHRDLSGIHNYLSSINKLLKAFENESFSSRILSDIKQNISGSSQSADIAVGRLSRLIQAFDARLNILVGFVLNGLLLWDYHCIYRLERWKSEYRKLFPLWLEMLGEMDAFISLANYAYNNPDFIYPEVSDNKLLFSASSMGHPLISESKRVCNDFAIDHRGIVCIISGANMAGKSTFLRTVAVNYILGMAGAPVCASGMKFKPLKLFTSMRTTDSLSNNESYFYAELKRLKQLKSEVARGEPVLFILDEILKGTNSADKSLGSKLFLTKMVELGGSGLIATHDNSLGEMETEYPGSVINRCFEIEIDGEIIRFDYKLQKGITHKMNAAFLMRQMGILE
jgi:hypothetical protein